jgi:RHS repeat-associated protein
LGTPRINTNATGQVIARHDYLPYGEEIFSLGGRNSQAGIDAKYEQDDNINQKFTGYERDDETGLDFAQARYYCNKHGRFTTTDPIIMSVGRQVDPQQINLYVYVRNNPFKFVDVSGKDLIPADAKSANQLMDDFARRLSKSELANLKIVAGQNITIINPAFQSNSTAYQQIVKAITANKQIIYHSIPPNSSVTINRHVGQQTYPWSELQPGATIPIDTNDLSTAKVIHIYVPESGGIYRVDGYGQLVDMPRDMVTIHEIAHGNCGDGQCAVDIENQIRAEQTPPMPLRSGTDHISIKTDKVQGRPTNNVEVVGRLPQTPQTTDNSSLITRPIPLRPLQPTPQR